MNIDFVQLKVAVRKPTYSTVNVWYPVLRMQSWLETLLELKPQYILGGHTLGQKEDWMSMMQSFWTAYREINPDHPVYAAHPLHQCVPYMLHGDEGRGLRRRPFLVEAFQPCLGVHGLEKTNESGHFASTKTCGF